MILANRRVVLGVSGGIACYKACTVARRLTESGADVDVVLTAAAAEFVRPVTFEALTRRPVQTSLWAAEAALAHIDLGKHADLVVVAPATAHLIARAAHGLADDVLTALLLATPGPVLLAPAMNDRMFAHPATQANLDRLVARGWKTIGPAVGALAEGPADRPGRMAEPEDIVAVAERLVRGSAGRYGGKRVVVTAGPTREEIDPVRVITNRSSGRMGFELAAAAYSRGADVTLIAGPTALPLPPGVTVERVETTAQLQTAVEQHLAEADLLIMAAAPSDFRPRQRSTQKIRRAAGLDALTLEPTADVLTATRAARRPGAVTVGFALETEPGLDGARDKLERKALDLIVLNNATEDGAGFEVTTNRVTLVWPDRSEELPLLSKRDTAEAILDRLDALL